MNFPKENIPKILEKALSRGGELGELYLEDGEHTSIILEDQKIENVTSGIDRGAGLRVLSDHRTIYAFSNDLSLSALMELAGAVCHAVGGAEQETVLSLTSRNSPLDFAVHKDPRSVAMRSKVEQVRSADAAARGADARVAQSKVIVREGIKNILVANSLGEMAEESRVALMSMVQAVARDGGLIQTGIETLGGFTGYELFDQDALEASARRAAQRAVRMLTASPAPAGRMPVVLSSRAGGTMIHEAVGHGLEADLAQQQLSVYSGRVGDRIASPLISVVDDATLPGKRGSSRFDDEGTPSQRTVLVAKGILQGYMYDRLTAMKDGVVSTANGRRESYRHRPMPRMTNTLILPGDHDPESIVRETPHGLLVVRMGGGQVNTVNGDFVFEVSEGYRIENGKIGEAVRGATLTGNGPEVLMQIDRVGSDLGYAIGTCGKDGQGAPVADAQPTLRIPEITVGGEV